jgi:hypothetical protein
MQSSHTTRVRVALAGVFVGLIGLAGLSKVHSQPPGFSGRPPGGVSGISGSGASGFSGMPSGPRPGFSGGISGNPGISGSGISGISGHGISGAHISGISGTGTSGISGHGISGMPSGISGMGRIPSMNTPSMPMYETVWKCTRCQAEVGRGPVKPNLYQCPSCGARIGGVGFTSSQSPGSTGGSSGPPVDSKTLVTIIAVVVGLAFLLGLVVFIVKMARGSGRPPRRAKRRRRVSLDDM